MANWNDFFLERIAGHIRDESGFKSTPDFSKTIEQWQIKINIYLNSDKRSGWDGWRVLP